MKKVTFFIYPWVGAVKDNEDDEHICTACCPHCSHHTLLALQEQPPAIRHNEQQLGYLYGSRSEVTQLHLGQANWNNVIPNIANRNSSFYSKTLQPVKDIKTYWPFQSTRWHCVVTVWRNQYYISPRTHDMHCAKHTWKMKTGHSQACISDPKATTMQFTSLK